MIKFKDRVCAIPEDVVIQDVATCKLEGMVKQGRIFWSGGAEYYIHCGEKL